MVATIAGMKHVLLAAVISLFLMPFSAAQATAERSPEDTVTGFLKAMQDHEFQKAYDYVSTTLRGGKGREEWAKEQQYIVQVGEVKIFGYKVYPATVDGEKAKVPNVLKSQDKFLNQLGLDEHEVYELLKEEGQWRIDQQMLVQTDEEKSMYFPEQ